MTNSFRGTLFHGTGYKFDKFQQKFSRIENDLWGGGVAYLTDSQKVAITYAKSTAKSAKTNTPYVYQVSVSFKNVFDVDRNYMGAELIALLPKSRNELAGFLASSRYKFVDEVMTLYKLETGKLSMSGDNVFRGLSRGMVKTAMARDVLIANGYDSLRYNGGENMDAAIKHNAYIAFNEKSLKIEKRFIVQSR